MDERWEKVAALNLNSVRKKFAFKKSWRWHLRRSVDKVERQYRQYLYLIVRNPDKTVVPWSRDLDDFWHEHILDTAKYAQDCNFILGAFIHHNPHLPEGSLSHSEASAETRKMYKAAFRESARKGRRRTSEDVGCGAGMTVVFCEGGTSTGHHSHSGGGGHHGGGHGCGGHGHGCGGHGCGGHGCGGHGCLPSPAFRSNLRKRHCFSRDMAFPVCRFFHRS